MDGKAIDFIVKNPASDKAFCPTESDKVELFLFAEESLRLLKKSQPGTIDDGLIRVDKMITDEGKMIVNEFESFEASFAKNEDCERHVNNCLHKFWKSKLDRVYQFVAK